MGPPTSIPAYSPPAAPPPASTQRTPLAAPPAVRAAQKTGQNMNNIVQQAQQAAGGQPITSPGAVSAIRAQALRGAAPTGPAFGDEDWVNPHHNPNRNANGYTRFDVNAGPGIGLERARTYADGARIYDDYAKLRRGQAGFTHHQNANQYLRDHYGVAQDAASDIQKFGAMDYAMTLAQRKNQRPKRKFGLGKALGLFGGLALSAIGAPAGAKLAYGVANQAFNR